MLDSLVEVVKYVGLIIGAGLVLYSAYSLVMWVSS